MPFDSEPPAEVTARYRVMRLRDYLAGLRPEQFDYREWGREAPCGTIACICGWQGVLMNDKPPRFLVEADREAHEAWQRRMAASLGLPGDGGPLFVSGGYTQKTPREAVAVLDHYLATGKIAWSVAA